MTCEYLQIIDDLKSVDSNFFRYHKDYGVVEIVIRIHEEMPELTGDCITLVMKGNMDKFSRNGTIKGLRAAGFGAKFTTYIEGHYMPMIVVTKFPIDSDQTNEVIEVSWGDY